MKRLVVGLVIGSATLWVPVAASATPSPNGPGQPGAPGTTCGSTIGTTLLTPPGNSANAGGSPFNANGTAGLNYAGNPGTASLAHSNSSHAVSQYDVACFQTSMH